MKKKKEIFITIVVLLVFCTQIFINIGKSQPTSAISASSLIVPMYHSVIADANKGGTYIITPEVFERDLIYLQENGYTSVSLRDLQAHVEGRVQLPEKAVLITFDDGHYNNYSYVLPLLEEYDMCAVINVVGEYSHEFSADDAVLNNNYSYLTWDNMSEMIASGRVEIGNHTYSLHINSERNGANIMPYEDVSLYREVVGDDIDKLQDVLESNIGASPTCFAYPFGFYSDDSEALLKDLGFSVTLSCEAGTNYILSPDDLYLLKRINRPYGISSTDFFAKFED